MVPFPKDAPAEAKGSFGGPCDFAVDTEIWSIRISCSTGAQKSIQQSPAAGGKRFARLWIARPALPCFVSVSSDLGRQVDRRKRSSRPLDPCPTPGKQASSNQFSRASIPVRNLTWTPNNNSAWKIRWIISSKRPTAVTTRKRDTQLRSKTSPRRRPISRDFVSQAWNRDHSQDVAVPVLEQCLVPYIHVYPPHAGTTEYFDPLIVEGHDS